MTRLLALIAALRAPDARIPLIAARSGQQRRTAPQRALYADTHVLMAKQLRARRWGWK